MSLSGDARAQAIYAATPGREALSGTEDGSGRPTADLVRQPDGSMGYSEKYRLLQGLRAVWGADTTYLTGNAEIAPGSLAVATGVPVSTSGSALAQTGATTAAGPLRPDTRGKLT